MVSFIWVIHRTDKKQNKKIKRNRDGSFAKGNKGGGERRGKKNAKRLKMHEVHVPATHNGRNHDMFQT